VNPDFLLIHDFFFQVDLVVLVFFLFRVSRDFLLIHGCLYFYESCDFLLIHDYLYFRVSRDFLLIHGCLYFRVSRDFLLIHGCLYFRVSRDFYDYSYADRLQYLPDYYS
jgi:hypothetical protein